MTAASACDYGVVGTDSLGTRYYNEAAGRFLTPDWSKNPEGVPYANYANPQSLNLYGYVLNNPETATDPDGHCCLDWFRRFFDGAYHETLGSLFDVADHPLAAARASVQTFSHLVQAFQGGVRGVVTVTQQIGNGDPRAIGEAVGVVGLALIPGAGEAGDTAEAAEAADTAADANKLHHIFGDPGHGLDALVARRSEIVSKGAGGGRGWSRPSGWGGRSGRRRGCSA